MKIHSCVKRYVTILLSSVKLIFRVLQEKLRIGYIISYRIYRYLMYRLSVIISRSTYYGK